MANERYSAIARIVFDGDRSQYDRTVRSLKASVKKDSAELQKSLYAGLALGAGAGFLTKFAAEFSQGLASVQKTSGLAGEELQRLGSSIRDLARDSIFGTDELLNIAAASAQLGVTGTDNLLAYTDAIAKLAAASDFTVDDAALSLARLSNIAGLSHDQVQNLSATFVALGNSMAASEREINESAVSIAAATTSYGVAADEILALSASAAAVGQASFSAGTSLGNFFKQLSDGVSEGGPKLQNFANIMGVTKQEVVELFETSPAEAFRLFAVGIGEAGASADSMLASVNIVEARAQRLIKSLGADANLLAQAYATAGKAFQEGTAHLTEYETMTNTLQASTQKLINKVKDLALELGQRLAPSAQAAVDQLNNFFTSQNIKASADLVGIIARAAVAWITFNGLIAGGRLLINSFLLAFTGIRTANMGVLTLGKAFKVMGTSVSGAQEIIARAFRHASILTTRLLVKMRGQMTAWGRLIVLVRSFGRNVKLEFAGIIRRGNLARLGVIGLTAGLTAAKIAAKLFGAAMKLAFLPLLFFLPETARFLYRVIPDALDYLQLKWRRTVNYVAEGFLLWRKTWEDMIGIVLSGFDKVNSMINALFGTNLSTTMEQTWGNVKNITISALREIDEENKRLEVLTEARFRNMAQAVGQFADEVKQSGAEITGINFGTSGGGPLNIPSGLGTPRVGADEHTVVIPAGIRQVRERDMASQQTTESTEIETPDYFATQYSRMEQSALELDRLDQRLADEKAERDEKAAKDEIQREADKNDALIRMTEEYEQFVKDMERDRQLEEEIRRAHEAHTENELLRMRLEGEEEEYIEHWERMRELDLERLEAKHAQDDAELQRVLDRMALEEKAYKDLQMSKIKEDLKQGQEALKIFGKHSKKINKISKDAQKAEALYNLAVHGPTMATKAWGRAVEYLPPPLGQIVGAASAAAVIARFAATVRDIEGMKEGGLVGGSFTLSDSQLKLLQPGETVIPRQNYADLKRMHQQEALRDQELEDQPRVQVDVAFMGDAANTLQAIVEGGQVMRV